MLFRKTVYNNCYKRILTFEVVLGLHIPYAVVIVDISPLFLRTVKNVFISEDFPDPLCPITMIFIV